MLRSAGHETGEEASVQKTRRQILDILKQRGSATLEELARKIGLSPVTIRAHLSVLERDGLIASDEVRGKVGRPHFVYTLSDKAQQHFPATYHMAAHRFLQGFKEVASPEQMALLVERVAERWAAEKEGRLAGKRLEERVAEVARIRTEEGAMTEWERFNGGYIIRQHHCTLSQIAQLHPEVCETELEYIRRLLGPGVSVEYETSISGGAQKCVYRIRP